MGKHLACTEKTVGSIPTCSSMAYQIAAEIGRLVACSGIKTETVAQVLAECTLNQVKICNPTSIFTAVAE